VPTDLKKCPSIHLIKMTTETRFAVFGSVQKQDLRCPDTSQLSDFAGEISRRE
jgi:hypothetical protein